MKAKFKYSTKYQNTEGDKNGTTLLKYLEEFTLKYENQLYLYEAYVNTQHRLYNVAQGDLSNANYYENFTNNVKSK